MTRQGVRRSLERYGDFLTVTQVADWLGVDRHTASQYLTGFDYLPNGKAKLYHKDDVTEMIMRKRRK